MNKQSSYLFTFSLYSQYDENLNKKLDNRDLLASINSATNISPESVHFFEFSTTLSQSSSLKNFKTLESDFFCGKDFFVNPTQSSSYQNKGLAKKNLDEQGQKTSDYQLQSDNLRNKSVYNYADNHYILAPKWFSDNSPAGNLKKKLFEHIDILKPFSRQRKMSQFELFWTSPINNILATATTRLLVEPTSLRDKLIREFYLLRLSVITKTKNKSVLVKMKDHCENDRDGLELCELVENDIKCSEINHKSNVNRFKGFEFVNHTNHGVFSRETTTSCSGSSEDFIQLERHHPQLKDVSQTEISGVVSTCTDRSSFCKIQSLIVQNSAKSFTEENKESEHNFLKIKKEADEDVYPYPLNTDDSPCFQDLIAYLEPSEMRSLFLALERSDPYISFIRRPTKFYDTLVQIGNVPRGTDRCSDRFSILAKLLVLKRMGQSLKFYQLYDNAKVKDWYNDTSSDQFKKKIKESVKKNLCIIVTADQLRFLKQPLQSIIVRLQHQPDLVEKPSSSPFVYSTRQVMKSDFSKRRRPNTDQPSTTRQTESLITRRRGLNLKNCQAKNRFNETEICDMQEEPSRKQSKNSRESPLEPLSGLEEDTYATHKNMYYYSRRAGRPKVNRTGCRCLVCHTLETPQWRFMPLFGDNWMDLVCNACYMKFNVSRPHLFRLKNRPVFPQLAYLEKPKRPTPEEYRIKGPCAFPHLMRRDTSKQSTVCNLSNVIVNNVDLEAPARQDESFRTIEQTNKNSNECKQESSVLKIEGEANEETCCSKESEKVKLNESTANPNVAKYQDLKVTRIKPRNQNIKTTVYPKVLYTEKGTGQAPYINSPLNSVLDNFKTSSSLIESFQNIQSSFNYKVEQLKKNLELLSTTPEFPEKPNNFLDMSSAQTSALYYYYSAAFLESCLAGYERNIAQGFNQFQSFSSETNPSLSHCNRREEWENDKTEINKVNEVFDIAEDCMVSSQMELRSSSSHQNIVNPTVNQFDSGCVDQWQYFKTQKENGICRVAWGLPYVSVPAAVQLGEPVQNTTTSPTHDANVTPVVKSTQPYNP
ncbi:uncharacterized protein LOC128883600 isoform X2 [Hylaeus volcanicus]|uniref:uncharacterized protein LOC128883600 isoform X2 n=1 Tax=Hylaeus volcanicus TaxID=313075 RepID=UPI0023B7FDD4|nr:uncharacterized protein LOC128883600 isoform X2 [Hylaeus volcanicus]